MANDLVRVKRELGEGVDNLLEAAENVQVRAVAAINAIESIVSETEGAWRDGFQAARDCLTEDEAFTLTADVEEDCWLESKTRTTLSGESE